MKLLPLILAWILQSGKEVNNFDAQDVSPGLKYFEVINFVHGNFWHQYP